MPADAADLNGKNILIVEDETIIALLLEDMLSDLGLPRGGDRAVARCARWRWSIA
ncbi:MAG: hypothetical protein WDM79_18485 [Terricaulis sp.]